MNPRRPGARRRSAHQPRVPAGTDPDAGLRPAPPTPGSLLLARMDLLLPWPLGRSPLAATPPRVAPGQPPPGGEQTDLQTPPAQPGAPAMARCLRRAVPALA